MLKNVWFYLIHWWRSTILWNPRGLPPGLPCLSQVWLDRWREKPLGWGWEKPHPRGLYCHMLISGKLCYSVGLLSLCHPVQPPSSPYIYNPQNVLPFPDPHWLCFGTVLHPCFPIDSPSPWPLLCTTVPCPYWTLSQGIRPFFPVFNAIFSVLPLFLSLVWVRGCRVCACADIKQHSDFQMGPCLLALIISNPWQWALGPESSGHSQGHAVQH